MQQADRATANSAFIVRALAHTRFAAHAGIEAVNNRVRSGMGSMVEMPGTERASQPPRQVYPDLTGEVADLNGRSCAE